jgi:glycosyltransferase involved in cell wall biosynthesis
MSRNKNTNNSFQLFWFSQTIGRNRGLEIVIEGLVKLSNPFIHLTLVGRYDEEMEQYIRQHASSIIDTIHIAGIIAPDDLPHFASNFDVGLATEIPVPENRNICLTNKIFTYILAGNCILASNTKAQQDFMNRAGNIGLLYKQNDVTDLASKIDYLYKNKHVLNEYKQHSRDLAVNSMNWEKESEKLIKLISPNET